MTRVRIAIRINRDEYGAFVRLVPNDPAFPASYDDWLKRRSEEDAQCRARGEILTEVIVHFYEFAIYCRAIGQKPSQFTLEAFGIQQAERKG